MATHFKWYPSSEEVIVPFNARYSFPSQANKAQKSVPRIPPKSGSDFKPGNTIRVEFPAQGYVNPLNTTLEFDVILTGSNQSTDSVRIQNGIQSIFKRVRLLYGATPLEDMINYNQIVRNLGEWTGTTQTGTMDQTTIADGCGGVIYGGQGSANPVYGNVNVRQSFIQGISIAVGTGGTGGSGVVPNGASGTCVKRYQVNFALGLFTQDKLIPTKFMASQLAVELTLEDPASCLMLVGGSAGVGTGATYSLTNVNLIPEILEFDSSYDASFLRGLQNGGVPIKFASWHTFIFSLNSSNTANLMIQEHSRSVKAIFAVQKIVPPTFGRDTHATFFDTKANSSMQNFQFRVGGRYFPGAPVQCSTSPGSSITNGGAEAYLELQKSLNTVGDYRLSTGANTLRWATTVAADGGVGLDQDYKHFCTGFAANGTMNFFGVETDTDKLAGNMGSCCFGISTCLETTNGSEISGLNAEEQSDISLQVQWAGAQNSGAVMEVYSYYDAMLVLRENKYFVLLTTACSNSFSNSNMCVNNIKWKLLMKNFLLILSMLLTPTSEVTPPPIGLCL